MNIHVRPDISGVASPCLPPCVARSTFDAIDFINHHKELSYLIYVTESHGGRIQSYICLPDTVSDADSIVFYALNDWADATDPDRSIRREYYRKVWANRLPGERFVPAWRKLCDSGMANATMLRNATATELAATRQTILNSFGENDTEATDLKNMDRLYDIESQIESASFESDASKLSGISILLESLPSEWDDFQERLFLQMQKFA